MSEARQKVFVAYSYRLYPGDEYRAVFSGVGEKHGVDFVYADTQVGSKQLLEKIEQMIRGSTFAIFDISDWNPNVTLELGIARGIGHPYFIAIDPSKSTGGIPEAPSDLRGLDRIQYDSMEALDAGLSRLIEQQFGRNGLLSLSIGEVIRHHVFAELDQFLKERASAPDRDTTVAILPSGPILPLETEVIIRELPSNEFRFPPDPFRPSAPVGPWITRPFGKTLGLGIAACLTAELATIAFGGVAIFGAAAALLVTLPIAAWFATNWHKRRAFERHTPYSVTYRRPRARLAGPFFVWNFADSADADDPHLGAREGDPRAVSVELTWRPGVGPGVLPSPGGRTPRVDQSR